MGKLKLGFMIIWDQELTMMLLVIGVQLCYIVQMEAGKIFFFLLLGYGLFSYARADFIVFICSQEEFEVIA